MGPKVPEKGGCLGMSASRTFGGHKGEFVLVCFTDKGIILLVREW